MTDENKSPLAIEGILRLRSAFIAAGMEPPAAVFLSTNEAGNRFMAEAERTKFIIRGPIQNRHEVAVTMADGSIAMEIDVAGIKVRWPADRRVRHNGAWRYE